MELYLKTSLGRSDLGVGPAAAASLKLKLDKFLMYLIMINKTSHEYLTTAIRGLPEVARLHHSSLYLLAALDIL